MRIAALALIGAVAVSVGLAGCAPAAGPSATPTPKATAVFSSDADALKAAEKAYAAYLAASDRVAEEGGADPTRLKGLVTKPWYSKEVRSSKELSSSGLHQVGSSSHSPLKLQQINASRTDLTVYTCVDLASVRYLDSQGNDKTPPRSGGVPVAVELVANDRGSLLIASNEPWSGQDFC